MGGWDSDDSDDEEKTESREFMAAFFREVDEVKDGIHAVQRATRKIERITNQRTMRSAILRNSADPIKDAYAHAADRYQDVLKLEQSVAELHQLFLDFALLTEQQGEALDQIEYQVRAAGEYVESGNADIRYAIKYQTELRRRYCCCCVIVVVVLAVILIYLAVTNPRLFKKIK